MKYISNAEYFGIQKGIEQGIEQGMQKGIQEGIHLARLESAKNLLAAGISLDVIKNAINLSEGELACL